MSINRIRLFLPFLIVASLLSGCIDDQSTSESGNPAPVVAVTIFPTAITLPTGGTIDFSASVSGSGNSAVTWTVDAGTITGSGTYTAPAFEGEFKVTVKSRADQLKIASATVKVLSSLDGTFASNGSVTTEFGAGDNNEINSLALQQDGKIVVAGFSSDVNGRHFALARYFADGTLDPTFDTDGKVTTAIGRRVDKIKPDDVINAMAIQSDGRIVVGGNTLNVSDNNNSSVLARYNADGSLDTNFGTGGIVTTAIGAVDSEVNGLALQADGKIVVAGVSLNTNSGFNEFTLARFSGTGSLDPSFGAVGIVRTRIGDNASSGQAITIQADRKILVAGFSANGSDLDFTLVRYLTDGTLDSGFGVDGIVTTPIGGSHDIPTAVVVQTDGKIIVAGSPLTGKPSGVFALVRYMPDGSLDAAFGSGGIVTTSIGIIDNHPLSLVIQPDGKIIAGGHSFSVRNQRDFAMARYLPSDGSLDPSFGVDGIIISPFSAGIDEIHGLAIQSDGKIVAAGVAFTDNNNTNADFQLARYNP